MENSNKIKCLLLKTKAEKLSLSKNINSLEKSKDLYLKIIEIAMQNSPFDYNWIKIAINGIIDQSAYHMLKVAKKLETSKKVENIEKSTTLYHSLLSFVGKISDLDDMYNDSSNCVILKSISDECKSGITKSNDLISNITNTQNGDINTK